MLATKLNLSYNENGDLTSDGIRTNTWNYKDQLIGSTNGVHTRDYLYDEQGNRVSSAFSIMGTAYPATVYPNRYSTYDGINKSKDIYMGDTLVATLETIGPTVTPYYIHTDHLGSSNAVSDGTGAKVQLLDYYPYGKVRINEQTTGFSEARQYIGQFYDADTNLNYLNARYYDGDKGRFISQDPIFKLVGSSGFEAKWKGNWRDITTGDQTALYEYLSNPQNLNSYSYSINNPIKYSDPNGDFYQIAIGAGVGFFGGLADQYVHDIVSNVENGNTGLNVFAFRSSLAEYNKAGASGALVGASFAAGGPLLAGVSSGTLSVSDDIRNTRPISWSKAAVNASITSVVGYTTGSGLFSKVPGREPGLFTTAFFSGKHTQNEIVKEGISVGVGLIKESISSAKKLFKSKSTSQ